MPAEIDSHWNIPPEGQHTIHFPVVLMNQGWRLSISSIGQLVVGILWKDNNMPMCAQIEGNLNFYSGVFHILQIVPSHIRRATIEADSSLAQILILPSKSD